MAEKQIRYGIEVDPRDGIQGLRQFTTAAQRAGKEAAKSLDDTATAGDKARAALTAMAESMDAELRQAAAAADALRGALGADLAGADIDQVVADLNRMGVTFDEIRADADKFADTLRQVDGVRVQQVNDGLDTTRQKLDDVRSSGDQSRSVLANLAGNTAQDMGELGGVVGSLGVGIGQLAEYAVDGNIALSNLAKVAGPMAALTLAVTAATSVIGGFRERAKAAEERLERLTKIMEEGGDTVGAYADMLHEVGVEATDAAPSLVDVGQEILGLDDTVKDLTDNLDAGGITLRDWARAIQSGTPGAQAMQDRLDALVESGKITEDQWRDLTAALVEGQIAWEETAAEVDQANRLMRASTTDLNDMLDALADPLTVLPGHWEALINDVKDGNIEFENASELVQQLADATGLTADEIIELAHAEAGLGDESDKASDALQAQVDALDDLAAAQQEATEKSREHADAMLATNDIYYAQRDAYRGLADASLAYNEAIADEEASLADKEEALDAVAQAADEAALADVEIIRQARLLEGETLSSTDALDAQTDSLLMQAATFQGPERQAILDHIGRLHSIPPEIMSQILTLIDQGRLDEAERLLNETSRTRDATVAADADDQSLATTDAQINNVARDRSSTVRVNAVAGSLGAFAWMFGGGNPNRTVTVNAAGQTARTTTTAAATAAPPVPVAVPAAAAAVTVPVQINVSAGVIGHGYDVERQVVRATRDATRLIGRRILSVGR